MEGRTSRESVKQQARVILYSKPGCHLCEVMKREIALASCDNLYEMEEINIETDPDLLKQYRYDIPVLVINGIERFRHRLSADEFRASLEDLQ